MRLSSLVCCALFSAPLAAQAPLERPVALDALELDLAEEIERARAATVLVWGVPGDADMIGEEWEMPLGSGVVVSPEGTVLTAGHVLLAPGLPLRVTFPDGRSVAAQTLGKSGTGDLGMLELVEEGDWPFVERAPADSLARFEPVFGLGYPGAQDSGPPVLRLGVVLEPVGRWLQTTCTIMQGDSGGPLFDRGGRLVGIHSWIESPMDRNFHAPIGRFAAAWERLVRGESWAPLLDGLIDPDIGTRPSPTLVFGFTCEDDGGGPRVRVVQPDSAAARAGLRAGDAIVRVERARVRSLELLERSMHVRRRSPSLTLALERAGQAESVELVRPDARPLEASVGWEVGAEDGACPARVSLGGARPRRVALATVVRADGWLVTKASVLDEDRPIRVELPGGDVLEARLAGTFHELDLALLAVDAPGLPVPEWGAGEDLSTGRLVAAVVESSGRPARVGVVDGPPRKVRRAWRGVLGVRVRDLDDPEAPGLRLRRPRAGGPAAEAGLLKGDVLLALDGEPLSEPKQMKRLLRRHVPGDDVVLELQRDGATLEFTVELCEPGAWWDAGGALPAHVGDGLPLSARRGGFASAFRHDAHVSAGACGGPLLDLSGKVVGINVARVDRVGCYAVPIERVLAAVNELLGDDAGR